MRIDLQTADKISLILKACRERGIDPVATLDRAGYLLHPQREAAIGETMRQQIHAVIDASTPTQLGGGVVPATAADMKRCILETIERMSPWHTA